MNKLLRFAASAAIISLSTSAHAWYWGAPPVYPYGVYGLTQEQQKAMAEQAAKAQQQAIEAQRKLAEQFAARQAELAKQYQERAQDPRATGSAGGYPFGPGPFSYGPPWATGSPWRTPFDSSPGSADYGPGYLGRDMKELWEESNARREQAMEEMEARREQSQKRMLEQRRNLGRYQSPNNRDYARPYRYGSPARMKEAPSDADKTAPAAKVQEPAAPAGATAPPPAAPAPVAPPVAASAPAATVPAQAAPAPLMQAGPPPAKPPAAVR